MGVILYSTGCPRCVVLKRKLKAKGIEFVENNDTEEMEQLGFTNVPMLDTGEEVLGFIDAARWVDSFDGGEV